MRWKETLLLFGVLGVGTVGFETVFRAAKIGTSRKAASLRVARILMSCTSGPVTGPARG